VTPAHDENDKILGDKHNLEVIDIFNDDATLNANGLHYEGMDRFVVRKEISSELHEKGYLLKTENYINKIGTSERTKAVIEPRLSDQWFLKMKDLSKPALRSVLVDGDIKLFPKKFENTYRHWMENIRDWNISRQLWWGQRIPAYYYNEGKDDLVVAENKDEAIRLARIKAKNPKLQIEDLRQDDDVLDTWFSSWLWPMSVFDGVRQPENKDFKYYYPTNDLVTGPDILFFWVARMIISGYEYTGQRPFKNVYLTGLVRDKQRRKMSKQLGNSPDALELIDEYGADGVRVGLLLSAAAGNDLMFDVTLCQQGKSFSNKIWNAFRLIEGWEIDNSIDQPNSSKIAIQWYLSTFQNTLNEIEDHYSKFRLSDVLMSTYKLIWDDFCSWLLEITKPEYGQPIDAKTHQSLIAILEDNLRVLHPFMPFITEEIWQYIKKRKVDEALIVSKWPEHRSIDQILRKEFSLASEVISGIRTIRKQKNISFKESIALSILNNEKAKTTFDDVIIKLGNLSDINYVNGPIDNALTFRVKSNEYFIPVSETVNVEEALKKLNDELMYIEGFLKSVQKKLSNERFVNNAPQQVIEGERKKEADAKAKIETIKMSLKNLK
jgi:valyl-tRNA synthetase